MDFTTAPRSLIYRERRSMEEFGAYEAESITRPLAETMLRMDFIQHSDSENRAIWCMNTAYYICTMILLEKDPRWRLSKYKCIAIPKWNFRNEDFQVLTLSLAGLLLSRLEEPLTLLSLKGQTRNHLVSLMIDDGEFTPVFKQLYEQVKTDPFIKNTIPNSTFAPRVIDEECIHDVMSDMDFNWVNFTKYWEERSVRDIVKCFGISEDEKHNVIDMLRQSSHGFYSAGCNDRPEQVDAMLDDIDQEIHLHYNPEVDRTTVQQSAPKEVDKDFEEKREEKLDDQKDRQILELRGENDRLVCEVNRLKLENDELRSKFEEGGNEIGIGWIDWLDDVFDDKINAEKIFETISDTNYTKLTVNCYWFVVFKVLSEIRWIPNPSVSGGRLLKWANAHFRYGWTGVSQFKFDDIDKRLKKTPISEWGEHTMTTKQGIYYRKLADILIEKFVWKLPNGMIRDRYLYLKDPNNMVNYGK